MRSGMNIAFFASSLVSAYWNGAATYYRGIVRALHNRGHRVTFYEPDAFDRQKHRDLPDPDWAKVVVYSSPSSAVTIGRRTTRCAAQPRAPRHDERAARDLIVKASSGGSAAVR